MRVKTIFPYRGLRALKLCPAGGTRVCDFIPRSLLRMLSGRRSLAGLLLLGLCFHGSQRGWAEEKAHDSAAAAGLNNVGVALMGQQFTEKALQKFEEAHKADPASAIPLLNKGIALLYLRRLPEAEETLKQATTVDPGNVRIWYCLGLAHLAESKSDVAVEDFKHAIKLNPVDADSHYYLGSLYRSLKDYDQAIGEFEEALRLNPLHASAQFGLASALQRSGKVTQAREHLKRFQTITQTKVGTPLAVTYGEQGDYATVQNIRLPEQAVGPMIPVSFVAQAGAGSATSSSPLAANQAGGGACILNVDGEKKIVVVGDGDSAIRVYKSLQSGALEEVPAQQTGLTASGHGIACAVGDYDSDGHPDLAVALSDRVLLFHNLGHGKFEDVTQAVGIQQLNHPAGLTFVDFDHDGDVDLFITGSALSSGTGPDVLWRNNGNSTFTEWTKPTGLAGKGNTTAVTLSDLNNDRAVDLIVTGDSSSPTIFENKREGAFKVLPLYADPSLTPTRGVLVSDFNKDGWMDVAVTHAGAPGVSLWRNKDGEHFERVALPLSGAKSAWGLTAIDIDNDGWIDLAAIVEMANGPELHVWRNRGAQGFEDVSDALGLNKIKLQNPRSVIAADIDGDGAADLIVTQLNAPPVVLRNVGGSRNHSLRLTLAGLADNKTAIGTKVEVFSNGRSQKFEVAGGSGYLSQGPPEILVGLGQADKADVVRMLWPTGVPQDELDVAAGKPVTLTELDRRGSSCPVLFAWDGSKYQFVTDVIGAGVIGHWISPVSTNHADPDEWIKVDGSQLKARDGLFSLRFGEPMEEINYIDQLRLVAVDHPEGTEVYPDERFLDDPPFASGATVVASSSRRLPVGAWDDNGRDVLPLLTARDHEFVHNFTNLSYAGYANMHSLTLDLGAWSRQNPLRLFMNGYIEYFSASSMYAAWQADLKPISPFIEAQMPDGSWKRVVNEMGFPAGLPRTMVVDLTGKLPVGTRRIRITTNLQIYWDQILVDNGPDSVKRVRQTELPLSTAHLAFRGYPQQVQGKTSGDLTYRYDRISATGPFHWQRGSYTKYGEVTPLLHQIDNHYVIFGSGEEIDAEFSAAPLPPLPPHWKRDYFFYANGFVKDMDFYEASPFTVAQMPFHEMTSYPYPASERYPDNPPSVKYELDWNDRFESGDRTQRFQFDYKPTVSQPITGQSSGNASPAHLH